MTVGMPDWASSIPFADGIHREQSSPLTRPFTQQQLLEIGQQLIEQFLGWVVKAVVGAFIPGVSSFDQLRDWAENLPIIGDIIRIINQVFGPLFGGIDLSNPLDPAAVWHTVVTAFMLPLNLLLGPNSPLNLANAFGRLSLPQFGGGVPLSFLTTAVPNLLEPFSASSVPTADGWSFDAAADAAKVICDGTTKTLYLNSSVIKVEPDQPLNTLIKVKYSGVSSTAGQSIRYVLDTFTSADGSGPSTPVVIGSIANPSGTITSPVSLGSASWAIPAGVQSVRPVLVTDALSAGTVYWLNTPLLEIPLQGVLAGGLPAALNNLGDWIESLVDQLLSALGVVGSGSLLDKIFDLADEFGGWLLDTQGVSANLDDLLGNLLSNPGSVIGTLPQSMISGLSSALSSLLSTATWQSFLDQIKGGPGGAVTDLLNRIQHLGSSGTFNAAQLANIANIPSIAQSSITGLLSDLGNLQTTLNQIGDIFQNNVVTPVNSIVQAVKDWWNQWFGGGSSNAIPLSQKGSANGVAPLNSSAKVATSYLETNVANGVAKLTGGGKLDVATYVDTNVANGLLKLDGAAKVPGTQMPDLSSTYIPAGAKGAANGVAPLNSNAVVPLANLPAEVGGTGGSGDGRPYVILYPSAGISVPNNTETVVSGWSQVGTSSVTFEDGTNTRWKFGLAGVWMIDFQAAWNPGTTGVRGVALYREIHVNTAALTVNTTNVFAAAANYLSMNGSSNVSVKGSVTPRVSNWTFTVLGINYQHSDADWFSLAVRHTQGSALTLRGASPLNSTDQSLVVCTYLGAS